MSGASEKARFYLEQSVPELKEYEKKKIFTPVEITSIARKRSDFEHKINARGSSPADYARYAEFEINVDTLRRKRVKRLGIKAPNHTGQRRIFFVLDRGTRKFPGDLSLWMQSIYFAKKQKAYKKLSQILTNVLRLNPTKSELWIYAAKFASEENGDMTEARSYMQRGLRFCQNARPLWLEYARLELVYITKVANRREILGINEKNPIADTREIEDDMNADVLRLPTLTSDDINPHPPGHDDIDEVALQNLALTSAMTGAIPMAIFDAAMLQFKNDPAVGFDFYDLVLQFDELACHHKILEHFDDVMMQTNKSSWQAQACHIRLSLASVSIFAAEFAEAISLSLTRLKAGLVQTKDRAKLAATIRDSFSTVLEEESLDPALQRVLRSSLATLGKIG